MRRVGKFLGRLLIALAVLAGIMWLLPREQVVRGAPITADLSDPDAVLAAREAAFDDITPGTEARIIWADAPGTRSDWVVIYLHGFSATHAEIRPVPDRVAEALGANLILTRLTGHGRGGAAMGAARAGDWVDDAALAMALAREIGDRVVIIGTSTGATLASYVSLEPDIAEGLELLVTISPNYRTVNPAGRLLELPFVRHWGPLVAGETRTFAPHNDQHGQFWTTSYPTVATVSMGTLLRETRARDYSAVDLPMLVLYSPLDQVVSAEATLDFANRWGGGVALVPLTLPDAGTDPFNHVIAGDILSPAMTGTVTDFIVDWVSANAE
jgi:alpha-beta hydrolase superfamily lysophospholipase